jgi:hypothetical protein
MQNREELRKKGHDGSRKMTRHERGKNIIFRRSGGINIVFGPKYRPLRCQQEGQNMTAWTGQLGLDNRGGITMTERRDRTAMAGHP